MSDFVRNPFATLIIDASADNPDPKPSIDCDSGPPYDPDDEQIDQAAFEAAFTAVFPILSEADPDDC